MPKTLTTITLECPEQYSCSYLSCMPISMSKTYNTYWKKNGQGKDGTVNFAIFRLFIGNKSELSLAILKFINLKLEFNSNMHVFTVWC